MNSGKKNTRDWRFEQAIKLLQKGQPAEAQSLLNELRKNNPVDPVILAASGTTEGMLGNFRSAETLLMNSISIDNTLPGSHYSLGKAQQALGKLEDAAESFSEACRLQPGVAALYNNLGNILIRLGHFDRAAAAYQKVLLLHPDDAGALTGKAVTENNLANNTATTDLVTVLIPAYNCENSISETVNSCLNQTVDRVKIIIINDYSTDNTLNIISRYSDKRVISVNLKKNNGKASALNKAIDVVTTPYISFIDADDYYKPDFLDTATTFLDDNPEYDMVYADYETLTPDGNITPKKALPQIDYFNSLKSSMDKDPATLNPTFRVLSDKGFIPACSAVIKREVFNEVRFDEKCFIEDIDLWCQIAGKRFAIKYLPMTSYVHRTGFPNQKMSKKQKMRESHDYILNKLKSGKYF